ncbi:MAG: OadG family transporter subunit [Romboutsia sp.]|uniref:OadG family transporter subunit n=1 Tax=Romboutsia sp. TaxID=1965302 RepID=UPI003F3523BC
MDKISMTQALYITAVSIGIVFITLLLISLILSSFKSIFKTKTMEEMKEHQIKEVALTDEEEEEDKIVVALAASMMAGQGKINPNLRIKSITRIK